MPPLLRSVFGPETLLFVVAAFLAWTALGDRVADAIGLAPYAAAAAGLLVAWRLRRSRLVFAVVTLTLAHALVTRWSPASATAFQLVACLLPLNLAVIALLPERGVFTPAGLVQWLVILAQAALVFVVLELGVRDLAPTLSDLLDTGGLPGFTPLGRPAIGAVAVAAALVSGGRWYAPHTTGHGYGWALAATALALHAGGMGPDRAIWIAAGAVILTVAAIELSYRMAYHDALTGLPGRRALDEAMGRLGDRYTIAMIDVDHFKQFNDTYGHDVGDQVLRTVAGRLSEAIEDGQVYRYGGEEFAVLLPGKTVEESLPRLETARQSVASEKFAVRGHIRPRRKPATGTGAKKRRRPEETITVSIGAAAATGRRPTASAVIEAADRALYRAKEGGRNQVCS